MVFKYTTPFETKLKRVIYEHFKYKHFLESTISYNPWISYFKDFQDSIKQIDKKLILLNVALEQCLKGEESWIEKEIGSGDIDSSATSLTICEDATKLEIIQAFQDSLKKPR